MGNLKDELDNLAELLTVAKLHKADECDNPKCDVQVCREVRQDQYFKWHDG